jgi:hypothetical protein
VPSAFLAAACRRGGACTATASKLIYWGYHCGDTLMQAESPKFPTAVWESLRPIVISWTVDLATMVLFWASILCAHFVQRLVLSQGWIPGVVHRLDVAEEIIAFVSIVYFLLASLVVTGWTQYRRVAKEFK